MKHWEPTGKTPLWEPAREGEKLWPRHYFLFNRKKPPEDFYTPEEAETLKARGYILVEDAA